MAKVALVLDGMVLPAKVTMVQKKGYVRFEKAGSDKLIVLKNRTLLLNAATKELLKRKGAKLLDPAKAKAQHMSPIKMMINRITNETLVPAVNAFFR
jgi:hypothetical protein